MEKVRTATVIASALLNINKDVITYKEIIKYQKELSEKLKGTNFFVNRITNEDIIKFCKFYCIFIKSCNNECVVMNNLTELKEKFNKFFAKDIDSELYNYLKYKPKYLIPLIENDKYIEYDFTPTENNFFENITNELMYIEGKYVIDLKYIIGLIYSKDNEKFLIKIINNSVINPSKDFDINNVLRVISAINILDDGKNKSLLKKYGMLEDVKKIKSDSKNLIDIFFVGKTNSLILSQYGISLSKNSNIKVK